MKLLRTGEPEQARLTSAVGSHLDVRQELGRVLNFINEHGRREALHEQRRVRLGEAEHQRIVQSHIGAPCLAEVSQEGGLANLSRSGQQDDWELLGCPGDVRFECSWDIHATPPLE